MIGIKNAEARRGGMTVPVARMRQGLPDSQEKDSKSRQNEAEFPQTILMGDFH